MLPPCSHRSDRPAPLHAAPAVRRGNTVDAFTSILVAALFAAPSAAHAFKVEHSRARFADQRYTYELTAVLDAPSDRIEAVLRDYSAYPTLDARILSAKAERTASGEISLETSLRVCLGPFCRKVRRVERVEEAERRLSAYADPERSDVRHCETHVEITPIDSGSTRVSYRTHIEPDFWIPAFVGRQWMLRTLEDASTSLFMNIEKRARE